MKKNIRKLSKKVLAASMAAVMLVGMMGCQKNEAVSTNESASEAGGTDDKGAIPTPDPNEKYTISFTGHWSGPDYKDGNYVETMIEKELDIDVNVEKFENDEAMNLMLSSGEMPDCGWFGKSSAFMYDQELVRTIPRAMVEKYCPKLIEIYDEYPALYAATLNAEDENSFDYLAGMTFQFIDYYLPNDYYRYDWLLESGIDLGVEVKQITDNIYVAEDGIELSTFTKIMDYFVNGDPNKTGKKDTIGINAPNLTQGPFFSAFGFAGGINDVNGRGEQYYTLDGYKNYLKMFADYYKKGLIDPQLITPDRNISWERVNKQEAGYWITSTNALNSWAVERPPLTLIEKYPDVKILMTPGVKPDGGQVQALTNSSPSYGSFYVNAKVDDQKLAKVLQFLNYSMFGNDLDSNVSLFYGEKDVDWKWNEAGDMPVKINEMPSGEKGTWSFSQFGQTKIATKWTSYEPLFEAGLKYWSKEDNGSWMKFQKPPYKEDLKRETDYTTMRSTMAPDIDAYVANYLTECILGKKEVDSTWDAYMKELDRLGYNELMDELNKVKPLDELLKEYSK